MYCFSPTFSIFSVLLFHKGLLCNLHFCRRNDDVSTTNASYIDMALYLYTEPLIMARMWAGVVNTIKYTEADVKKEGAVRLDFLWMKPIARIGFVIFQDILKILLGIPVFV